MLAVGTVRVEVLGSSAEGGGSKEDLASVGAEQQRKLIRDIRKTYAEIITRTSKTSHGDLFQAKFNIFMGFQFVNLKIALC